MSTRYKLALGVEGISIPDYYEASPIWKYATNGQLSPVGLADLPWRDETVSRIHDWWRIFRNAMVWSDPKVRGFKSDEAFNEFVAQGVELAETIKDTLAPGDSLEISLASPRFVRLAEPQIDNYRIFPEWGQLSPIWNGGPAKGPYNLLLDHLQISDGLSKDLRMWLNDFLDTFNEDYPPDSGFSTPAESHAFLVRGRTLTERFAKEIGGSALVVLEYAGESYIPPTQPHRQGRNTEVSPGDNGPCDKRWWQLPRFRRER
jgi:hypothetical protein